MTQSKHDLKDSPAFPIPGIFMQLNVISDHQSLKKHLFVRSGQTKLVENIPFLLHLHSLTRFDSNYTDYQLACQNSWHTSAYPILCYKGRVRMHNMQLDIYVGNIPEPFGPIQQSFV